MMFEVNFSPEAEEHLASLYQYIADRASPDTALNYLNAVIDYCEGLNIFPLRGTKRDDIRTGLRILNYKRKTLIAFIVHDTTVSITGVFHGGRDYEATLKDEVKRLADRGLE